MYCSNEQDTRGIPQTGDKSSPHALAPVVACPSLKDVDPGDTVDPVGNLAREHLSAVLPQFHAARNSFKDRKARDAVQLSLLPSLVIGGSKDRRQLASWKEFLDYERSNVQRLDADTCKARVLLAYQQACTTIQRCGTSVRCSSTRTAP